jgi:SAM-dependent methyltransferase
MRALVGQTDPDVYDNPSGVPIYDHYGLPLETYEAVFDVGSGCGRQARQLLLQTPGPRRFVGIDIHWGMVEWCRENLTPLDPNFQFLHHDVYSPTYAPDNRRQLTEAFPVEDAAFTLVLAHSVFTHLYQDQAEYYLREVARILRPGALAFTSGFFFERRSCPFLAESQHSLFANEIDPTQAVLYAREWVIDAVRRAGLSVWRTEPPAIPGHQWTVFLRPRAPDAVDRFPLGEEGAEWLSGATARPMASPKAAGPASASKPGR